MSQTKKEIHLNHTFYKESHDYRETIRRGQIIKGSEKYEEPFNPASWTDQELEDHAMMENVDQEHYIVGLGRRIKALREENAELKAEVLRQRQTMDHVYSTVGGIV